MSAEPRHERLLRISRVMAAVNGEHPARDLCQACVEVVGVTGASVMVMSEGLANPLASSDPVAARIEDLQHTIGEGNGTARSSGASSSRQRENIAKLGVDRGAYVRVASTNRRADTELLDEMRRASRGEAFDEQPLPKLALRDTARALYESGGCRAEAARALCIAR